jgi:hypothetical protein
MKPQPPSLPDRGAAALRERQVVRRRELPPDAAHAERRDGPPRHGGRVPRRSGGGVPRRGERGAARTVRAAGRSSVAPVTVAIASGSRSQCPKGPGKRRRLFPFSPHSFSLLGFAVPSSFPFPMSSLPIARVRRAGVGVDTAAAVALPLPPSFVFPCWGLTRYRNSSCCHLGFMVGSSTFQPRGINDSEAYDIFFAVRHVATTNLLGIVVFWFWVWRYLKI